MEVLFGITFCAMTAAFVGVAAWAIKNQLGPEWMPGDGYAGPDAVYVACLSVGVDWRLRDAVAAELAPDSAAAAGKLFGAFAALRDVERAWLYVGFVREPAVRPERAAARLAELVGERSSVQGDAGARTMIPDGPTRGRPLRGEGVAVLHIVFATRRELRYLERPSAAALHTTLDDLDALDVAQVVDAALVWAPTSSDRCLLPADVARAAPDVQPLDLDSVADRTFCARCRFPFTPSLAACPHCDAPA